MHKKILQRDEASILLVARSRLMLTTSKLPEGHQEVLFKIIVPIFFSNKLIKFKLNWDLQTSKDSLCRTF
jgi:hypothetical protein